MKMNDMENNKELKMKLIKKLNSIRFGNDL